MQKFKIGYISFAKTSFDILKEFFVLSVIFSIFVPVLIQIQ